jgi:hypothetical protein
VRGDFLLYEHFLSFVVPSYIFNKFLDGMAYNVPAVYDVGMFANEVGARSDTRAVAEAELPNGAASPA